MKAGQGQLPAISTFWLNWFSRYNRRFLSRNFHGLHLMQLGSLAGLADKPLLVCMNHPGWWDPLIGLYLSQRFFPERANYGPMAAKALEQYKFFAKLGGFGIDPDTRAGAAKFLRMGAAILNDPKASLWMTPQGAFSDVRLRPVRIEMGAAHLPRHTQSFSMLPIAVEYTFWEERYPEAFVCMGKPLHIDGGPACSSAEWASVFANSLEATQDTLASRVMARDRTAFQSLLTGRSGIGGVYDWWRASRARLQGKKFHSEHGNL